MPDALPLKVVKGQLFLAWKGDLGPMRDDLATRPPTVPDPDIYVLDKVWLQLYERKFDEALATLRESNFSIVDGQTNYITRDALEAEILTQAGRRADAKPIWQRAATALAKVVAENPDDARIRMAYALALAGTGDAPDAALREARKAAAERSIEKDAMDGTAFQTNLALVKLRNGDVAGAAEIVGRLRRIPSIVYDSEFNLLPAWDALRSTSPSSGTTKP